MTKSDYILEYHNRGEEIERLREALQKIERHGPIMGSTGDYRRGQLDILEVVSNIAGLALVANAESIHLELKPNDHE
jgi:hypothetical protein